MPHPKLLPSSISTRRFSSRRPRPSIASIADLFLGSLVLAGYCHEHSPRCRGLSTISTKTPGYQVRTFRRDSVTDGEHQPAQKPWQYSGSWPRQQLSQHRSQLSTANTRVGKGHTIEDNDKRELKETCGREDEIVSTSLESPENRRSISTIWNQYFDAKTPNHPSHPNNQLSIISDNPPETPEESLSYEEKRFLSTASLYRKILGKEYNWKEAVKLVLPHPQPQRLTADEHTYETDSSSVAQLIEAVHSKPKNTPQYLFSLYRNIPSPGVEKLPTRTRGALLRQLANPPDRRPVDVRRYLALVDDMINCNIPMSRSLWTTAISFASRRAGRGRTSKRNVVHAIGLWQQMEHYAKIEADEVVFNILYDAAIKAAQFSIAERLEKEMIKRHIPFTRFSLIPKLNYYAEHKDVEGISHTFDNFVRSGNLVDTVILNGLLSAFLKAGDFETAEGIYERMLLAQNANKGTELKADATGNSLSTRFEIYRSTTKQLGRLLKLSDTLKDYHPTHYRALQHSISLDPDTRTFHILLRHYAITTGRFDKVLHIVRDMENAFKVPPRHMIYSTLFEGFSIHGKSKKQTWTPHRLWLLWRSYVWALIDSRNTRDRHSSKLLSFKKPDQPGNAVWVNPFVDEIDAVDAETKIADEKSGIPQAEGKPFAKSNKAEMMDDLYMPLPSVAPRPDIIANGNFQAQEDSLKSHARSDSDNQTVMNGVTSMVKQELSVEQQERSEFLFNSQYFDNELQGQGIEQVSQLEGRLENGVFVGRSTILHVLRAFGTCTSPEDVIEAWEQMQDVWDPYTRSSLDVSIIKEELERQLDKYRISP